MSPLLCRKHALLFLLGFVSVVLLGIVMPDKPPELDKVWAGISGAVAQGVLFGLAGVIPMAVVYGIRERNINHAGMFYSLYAGVIASGPFTSPFYGYPVLWSVVCPITGLVFISLVYRMLYRFHFNQKRAA
jgi:hypothetical protein